MQQYTEKIRIRLTKDELSHLKKSFSESKTLCFRNGRGNFSGYLRNLLLQSSNYKNISLLKQMNSLRYEIRKIGVNINQVAKKVNSGFGTKEDIAELQIKLEEVRELLRKYEKEVEQIWESPS